MVEPLRVLVVDDHPVNRLVLTELFTHLGCAVSCVEDGAKALDAAQTGDFDLVCLDRHMPGLSGDEVAMCLNGEQFVLAWSTDLSDLPARYNGVLPKPVTLDAVTSALRRAADWRARAGRPVLRRGGQAGR